jgi:hypothetical protein
MHDCLDEFLSLVIDIYPLDPSVHDLVIELSLPAFCKEQLVFGKLSKGCTPGQEQVLINHWMIHVIGLCKVAINPCSVFMIERPFEYDFDQPIDLHAIEIGHKKMMFVMFTAFH